MAPDTGPSARSKTVHIRNAAWVVAWDASTQSHTYRRDIDVVFRGDRISFVGPSYGETADERVEARQLLVMPGLIDVHAHPTTEPGLKGVREDHGVPAMYMTGLYERIQAFQLDDDGRRAAAAVAYAELLASGVTTLADLSAPLEGWVDLAAQSGLRVFLAPAYASARWRLTRDHALDYGWDEPAGRRGLDRALELIAEAERHPSRRLSGLIFPAQIDTCTEALFRDSLEAARATGRPLTTHAAQSVVEFNVMVGRHGKTPIQWASEIGLLGPRTLLGHAIFIDEHSWLHWASRRDLGLLAESGTSIAHSPTPFARYGQTLENLGRYLRAGVNVGLGTDVSPHNLLEEMRWAVVLARIAGEDVRAVSLADVFHAATVGGATALGRRDLGRLAPGMKADLVLVDLADPGMMPVRDPLRTLVHTAAERAVRDVYVDGIRVVANRQVLTLNRAEAADRLQEAQRRMLAAVPTRDYAGRSAEQIAPLSLRLL